MHVLHHTTAIFPRTLSTNILHANWTDNTFSSQNLPDIYNGWPWQASWWAIGSWDQLHLLNCKMPCWWSHFPLWSTIHSLICMNLTSTLLQHSLQAYRSTPKRIHTAKKYVIPYHMAYYCTGNPDTLQKHLQQPPTYIRDLWKPL